MISLILLSKISFSLSLSVFQLFFSSMGSNFHYSIDLNEDQNHNEQPFFYPFGSSSSILHDQQHQPHQVPSNSSSSSSSISSLSSYIPFLINSQEDQHVAYNITYHADNHLHLSQPLKATMFNGGSSSSYDYTVPKKDKRLKLSIRKKDHHEDKTDFHHQNPTKPNSGSDKWLMSPKMRLIKKTITSNKQPIEHINSNNNNHKEDHYPLDHETTFKDDHDEDLKKVSTTTTTTPTTENRYSTINENGYGNNNGVIRVCSDCNTTKTPLWRSGPRGPKSLCNACGIRQRKARRAAMAAEAAAGDDQDLVVARLQQLPVKKKLQNKKRGSNGGDTYNLSPPVVAKTKKCKFKEDEDDAAMVAGDSEIISKAANSFDYSVSSNKFCFDDLTIILSKSSAYQKVFPQDEKEAAILLMALSYGMVHG